VPRRRWSLLLLALVALQGGCKEALLEVTGGSSGHSFLVGEQFVILKNGFLRGDVTWVAVRNWPASSTPEQRLSDTRVTVGPQGCCLIRQANVGLAAPEQRLYFFDGDTLTTFRIRMKEDDFIGFRPASFKSYSEVLEFFQRFEVKS
jgi:hypothetical protein